METYGYARVSSTDQNEDRQVLEMQRLKIPKNNIYTDKVSGKDFDRTSYKKLIRKLKKAICCTYFPSTAWDEIMRKYKINGG